MTDIEVLARQALAEYQGDQQFHDVCVAGARLALAWDRFNAAKRAYIAKHPRPPVGPAERNGTPIGGEQG